MQQSKEPYGIMYYSPYTIQEHVKEIIFIPKSRNYVGLQIADFVPNTLGRYAAGLKPKNADFEKMYAENSIKPDTLITSTNLALRFFRSPNLTVDIIIHPPRELLFQLIHPVPAYKQSPEGTRGDFSFVTVHHIFHKD